MQRSSFFMVVTLLFSLLLSGNFLASQSILWEIGKFDQSSGEFNDQIDLSSPNVNPVFTIGQSVAMQDWPYRQPGSQNKASGGRPHPLTILFHLSQKPQGVCRLTISALLYNNRVPQLHVEINGNSGVYYFNRKLSNYPGDGWAFSPIYASDLLEIDLPSKALHAGENKLVLTALDDPADGDGESFLTYDALRLSEEPMSAGGQSPSVSVEPTVLYTGKDPLREQTHVTVNLPGKIRTGTLVFTVGRQQFEARLSTEQDFGQQRFDFGVLEFPSATPALVTLRIEGKIQKFPIILEPKRKWTIFVTPHQHLDIGYTDFQSKVAEVQNRGVDKLLDQISHYPEMRFSLDGSWIVQQYLATRNEAAKKNLLALVREGKIAVPAMAASLLTGYASLEVLIRSASYAYSLHQEYGLPFEYTTITDIPSYSWSYASVLNALGLKYFVAASNNDRGPILLYGRWNEKSPYWWQGPDGNKILMSYSRQYAHLWFICGLPPQIAAARQSLPTFLQTFQSPGYKLDAVLMYGAQAENTDLVAGTPEFVAQWNLQYAYPKLVLSTFPDYMRYVEKNFGSSLETVSGDGGPYWEDGMGTDAWYGAIDRSNQQRAASAEKLSTLATFVHQNLAAPVGKIQRMWSDLVLFSEHTWTSWGAYTRPEHEQSVRQLVTKDHLALDGREMVNGILDQSFSQLAYQIRMPAPAVVVFNPLSWPRSDLVEGDLDNGMVLKEYPSLSVVPFEVLRQEKEYSHIRFLAQAVPSLGYKCYAVSKVEGGAEEKAAESQPVSADRAENSFYRIEVDSSSGAVRSLFDKQLNRELVDSASPYRLNQYLYVSGGDETSTQIVYLRKSLPLAKLIVNASSGTGKSGLLRKTPFGQTLSLESKGAGASIETEIILFDNEKKVEFINRLHKEPVRSKEGVYFAFPFAVDRPAFNFEIQNGWVDPAHNMLKGACLEWFTVQHWVRVINPELAIGLVPVDAPLVTLGDINRGTWPETFAPKSSTVFSYVINNYWHTNFRRVQGGDYTYRYVLTSDRELSPEQLSRFGRAAMTPLEFGVLQGFDKFGNPDVPLKPDPVSFLKLEAPNVVVENWKAAEDGQGTIVRLLEVGGREVSTHLAFPLSKIQKAWRTNAVEENQSELIVTADGVEVMIKPHEILTMRVMGKSLVY